jgi:hypothetical protein
MRLDHVSYVTSHDQISDVVNRIGAQIGTAFIDGGIHPKFGTRNFTAPLLNGQYIEVVCAMDHPATETTPFGKAVKNKAEAGGGWFAWVISTERIEAIEKDLGRKSILGTRKRPDGSELHWKQIGVIDTLDSNSTFFIQWLTKLHPSNDGNAVASISSIKLYGSKNKLSETFVGKLKLDIIKLEWIHEKIPAVENGIESIDFNLGDNIITII